MTWRRVSGYNQALSFPRFLTRIRTTTLPLLPQTEGLVMRPHLPGLSHPLSYVRVPWGKHPNVQELRRDGSDSSLDWKSSVVVYGIVGIMELFNGTEM
ncbi:hypothetical protein J3R82DRAFT_5729 [Butyriboletus roseoflavus]|nr:hypothetical protein J3R82DRAFT_5729 [Butyriboletus roseoflavus]